MSMTFRVALVLLRTGNRHRRLEVFLISGVLSERFTLANFLAAICSAGGRICPVIFSTGTLLHDISTNQHKVWITSTYYNYHLFKTQLVFYNYPLSWVPGVARALDRQIIETVIRYWFGGFVVSAS